MFGNVDPTAFLLSIQAGIFAVLSFIFLIYLRLYNREYVKYWFLCILALTCFYISSAILSAYSTKTVSDYLLLFFGSIQQTTSYLFLSCLLLGLYCTKAQRSPSKKIVKLSFSSAIIVAVSTVIFSAINEVHNFYLALAITNSIFAFCYLAASYYLLVDKVAHFSSKALLTFCLLFGLRYLAGAFVAVTAFTQPWFSQLQLVLLYVDIGSHSVLGFILLVWVQGAERNVASHVISRAQYLGRHDSLTGALNRQQVMEKLAEAIVVANEKNYQLAVFLIDIKQFKFINDTYGLKTGDFILGEIAKRLNNSVLQPKAVGRLSGDSFMFVIELNGLNAISTVPQHLHDIINHPYTFVEQEVSIQGSVGYCTYPEDGQNAEDLLQRANLALHHAETNNIATIAFESGMQAEGRRLVLREKELKAAINNDEFVLYYQPQLNLLTNRLEGVEALVRWQHPTDGLLSPASFLDDIDALSMNSLFDNYILAKACNANARWYQLFKRRIAIAVNITAVEFQDPRLIANIKALLIKNSLPPKYLELEITENVVMTDITSAMNNIINLQSLGIKVSIDDFGTGYSSLAYLRKLPIDKIKIDRSFIMDMTTNDSDLTVVKSMIELSHGLGKRVLAEGVESSEQLSILRNLGCDAVQGYFIDKPLPEKTLLTYIARKSS